MRSANELHVVYGAGPVGNAVVEVLLAQNKRVRVVTRSGTRKHLPPQAEIARGDATDPADARQVCTGATHVYNCTNPVDYHRWPEQFPPLQRGVLEGAAANGAKLIVMENLYMYGPHNGVPMTETLPLHGRGSRSTTRVQMTEELFAAHRSGKVRVTSVRASDLFGPHVTESLVGERLFGPVLAGKPAHLFANPDLPHSVSYIHDVGRALVTVGAHDAALGRAWHAPNAPTTTLRAFVRLLGEEAGVTARVSALPRPVTRALLPLLGVMMPSVRGLTENLHIGYEPYIVDHSAYTQTFGDHATPLREAIRATVQWYRERSAHDPQASIPSTSANILLGAITTPLLGALGGALTGAIIGIAQWLVLRRFALMPTWIAATALGMAVGLALSIALVGTRIDEVPVLLRGLITGTSIGIAQWVLLRTISRGAPLWVLIVALSWTLSWLITRAVGVDLAQQWTVFGSSGAVIFQLLTGVMLRWLLLDQSKHQEPSRS